MLELADTLANLEVVLQGPSNPPTITPKGAAALAVGLAALGAGIAERGIGAAAVGAIAEDRDLFGTGLILTVLPETLVILALVVVFVVPDWAALYPAP
ncbi:MAG: F0F1 ATP synthase subunit C [Halobacteriaceae archaeon]